MEIEQAEGDKYYVNFVNKGMGDINLGITFTNTLIRETHYHNLWCIPDKYWV